MQLSNTFCNLYDSGSCFNRIHNKCTFFDCRASDDCIDRETAQPCLCHVLVGRGCTDGASQEEQEVGDLTHQRRGQTAGQPAVPVPTPCGCLASRAGASPFGEQSVSVCPRQSGAQTERAML